MFRAFSHLFAFIFVYSAFWNSEIKADGKEENRLKGWKTSIFQHENVAHFTSGRSLPLLWMDVPFFSGKFD